MSIDSKYEDLWYQSHDMYFHDVGAGLQDGPVVILLHGFPECWYGWRNQIVPLAAAGFRMIAPDQRGYNTSSKPRPIAAYKVTELTSDVIPIMDQLCKERAYIVGHDWGAVIAWHVVLAHPERVIRVAILNVPHPFVIQHNIRTNPRQWLKSWCVLLFQIPWLAEFIFSAAEFMLGKRAMIRSSRPGTFQPGDLAKHVEAWSQPGAMTGMIN